MMSVGLSSITDSHFASIMGGEESQQVADGEDGGSGSKAQKVFGRDSEKLQLCRAFERVQDQQETRTTVVLHGASGTGKTCLIDMLREPVCESKGYFCAGKFFQNSGIAHEPYSAIMAAFSDLCDLISQSDEFLEADSSRKKEIQRGLGEDGHLLSSSISNISQFLDHSNESARPKAETVFTMFKVACKTFLRVMASKDHPVVLVLDDVQWMDDGSEQLIRLLLEDNEIKNVLLILVYRDEESENVVNLFYGLKKNRNNIVDIQLQNLDTQAIYEMMTSILNTAPDDTETLALSDLIVKRTHGNPFYVRQFGEFLEQEGLLEYSNEFYKWKFNVETIRRETMLSESLADVLTKKIQRLAPEVQKALIVAALLGFHFSGVVVAATLEAIQEIDVVQLLNFKLPPGTQNVITLLDDAVRAGFIEKTSEGFQFGHDKLQSSFHFMLDHEEILHLHRVIGETFLQQGDEESIYHAAVHLNRAGELFQSDDALITLAQISLDAAMYCKQRSAFFNGVELLRAALQMIPPQTRWTEHYIMTVNIVGSLAKMELVIGNFAACNTMNEDLLFHSQSTDEKLDSLITCVEVAIAENSRVTECAKAVNKALGILGIKLPSRLSLPHIVAKLLKVKLLLRGRTDDDILGMPHMSDKGKITAVQLLVYGAIFGLVNDQEKHAIYFALLVVELSLKSGLSKFSPNAFAIYSMAELVMGNLNRSYRFGNLAKTMVDHLQCQQTGSGSIILVNNMVAHWRESLRHLSQETINAMNVNLEAGDLNFGIFGAAVMAGFRTCTGENLAILEEEYHALYSRFKNFKQYGSIRFFEPNFQFVLNMRHHDENWRALTDVSGDIMLEGDFIRNAIESNRQILLPLLWILKLQLAYHYGADRLAESVLSDLDSFKQIMKYSFNFSTLQLYGALTFYERYRVTSHRKHLRKARRFKRSFHGKVMSRCPNAIPLLTLLNAEEVALKGTLDEGSQAYDVAIEALANAELVHLEALANERAAYNLCIDKEANDRGKAEQYFLRAIDAYRYGWGATAKSDWLDQRKDRFLSSITSETVEAPFEMLQITEETSKE